MQPRVDATDGLDPVFRTNDGADCPSAGTSTTEARRRAYSMLLAKGLIRVSLGVPDFADFSVTSIRDPHGCRDTNADALALFRRPLPSSNLRFLTTVMWDGRESLAGQSLDFSLSHHAVDATLGHAQAFLAPTADQVDEIVRFEMALSNAQSEDIAASDLGAQRGRGGPLPLSHQEFYVGINDPLGGNPKGAPFDPEAVTLFREWLRLDGKKGSLAAARASIARGEALFNTVPVTISGVTGLNDLPGVPASFQGTCTTCHDTPNVGNHSVALAIAGLTELRVVRTVASRSAASRKAERSVHGRSVAGSSTPRGRAPSH